MLSLGDDQCIRIEVLADHVFAAKARDLNRLAWSGGQGTVKRAEGKG